MKKLSSFLVVASAIVGLTFPLWPHAIKDQIPKWFVIAFIFPCVFLWYYAPLSRLFFGRKDHTAPVSEGACYISEDKRHEVLSRQASVIPRTMTALRERGVVGNLLQLEYFFYTNAAAKADSLSAVLKKRGFSATVTEDNLGRNLFSIVGWTTPLQVNEAALIKLTRDMCELGFQYDCDFDSWGLKPNVVPRLVA